MTTAIDAPSRHTSEHVLVVVGTRHARTRRQLEAIADRALVVTVDPHDPELVGRLEPLISHADGLVLTGGYTARSVLELLGVGSFRVGGEVEIGVPWSIAVVDGRQIPFVTKAGGFGDERTLRRAVDFLSQS